MRRTLSSKVRAITLTTSILITLSSPQAQAGELTGTLNLADMGTTWQGVTFTGLGNAGISVSGAGDINGDGISDLLIGANKADPDGNSDAGETYLVYGRSGASALSGTFNLTNADVIFTGIASGDKSGVSVSVAGDINGDGFDDLLIGASYATPNGNNAAGQTYLVYGKGGASALSGSIDLADVGTSIQGVVFNGMEAADLSGISVVGAGDVNGDGKDDLLISAPGAGPFESQRSGETYLVYGRSGTSELSGSFDLANSDAVFKGIDEYDHSGEAVSSAGDVNGDGNADFLIGAPFAGTMAGETYLIYGQNGAAALDGTLSLANVGSSISGVIFEGESNIDFSGISVSGAGDVNGDGLDDLLIGAPGAHLESDSDYAYLVYGKDGALALSGAIKVADVGSSVDGSTFYHVDGFQVGSSVSSAGDVNGDGFDDILIGAEGGRPFLPASGSITGQVYLVYGGSDASLLSSSINLAALGTTFSGALFNGLDHGHFAGASVSNAGDVNDDGIDDFLIGAHGANSTYLVYGQAAVPEPGTVVLLGAGLVGLVTRARRRRGARRVA